MKASVEDSLATAALGGWKLTTLHLAVKANLEYKKNVSNRGNGRGRGGTA